MSDDKTRQRPASRTTADDEMTALAAIVEAMLAVDDHDVQQRMLRYVWDRFTPRPPDGTDHA